MAEHHTTCACFTPWLPSQLLRHYRRRKALLRLLWGAHLNPCRYPIRQLAIATPTWRRARVVSLDWVLCVTAVRFTSNTGKAELEHHGRWVATWQIVQHPYLMCWLSIQSQSWSNHIAKAKHFEPYTWARPLHTKESILV